MTLLSPILVPKSLLCLAYPGGFASVVVARGLPTTENNSALRRARPTCIPLRLQFHPPSRPSHTRPPGLYNSSQLARRGAWPRGPSDSRPAPVGCLPVVSPLHPVHKGVDRGSVGRILSECVGPATAASLLPTKQIRARSTPKCSAGNRSVSRGMRRVTTPQPSRPTVVAVASVTAHPSGQYEHPPRHAVDLATVPMPARRRRGGRGKDYPSPAKRPSSSCRYSREC